MSMDDTIDRSDENASQALGKTTNKILEEIRARPNRLKTTAEPTNQENLTRAQKFAQSQKEYKLAYNQKSKERAKAAKQTYLARPDVQEKMRLQKEKFADYRKQKSTALKNAKKSEKSALGSAEKLTRRQRQETRDGELCDLLGRATELKPKLKVSSEGLPKPRELNQNDSTLRSETRDSTRRTPKFTVIHCERK